MSKVHKQSAIPVVIGAISIAILIVVVWWNRFLPMQDYPQHLFMATVAGSWDDPAMNWQENFELRNAFGPYRGVYLAQRALGSVMGMEAAGKMLVSFYLLLMGVVAWRLFRANASSGAGCSALLIIPLSLHPMYFYGFLNFTFALPFLLLLLLELEQVIRHEFQGRHLLAYLLLLCLFLLHPYALLCALVLSTVSLLTLARGRVQFVRGLAVIGIGLMLLLGWVAGSGSGLASGDGLSLAALNMKWWQWEWTLQFLAMSFTGMRITQDPDWYVAVAWGGALLFILAGLIANWSRVRFQPRFLLMALLALAGLFILPFSLQADARYTFFHVRLVPVASLLLVAFLATIPLGRIAGLGVAVLSLALTLSAATLHHRLAREVESYLPLLQRIEPGATVLPLVQVSPSLWLDGFFYVNFHYHFPFYYHVLKGGNSPDMFNTRMMPVGYRPGRRTPRHRHNQPGKWSEYREHYDYVITRRVSVNVHRELKQAAVTMSKQGPWSLYQLR